MHIKLKFFINFASYMDNKTFLNRITKESGLDKEECSLLIESLASLFEDSLSSGASIAIPGFGNFDSRKRNERIMTHPSSPQKRMMVPPKVVVGFKPSTLLKSKVNETDQE